MVDSQGDRMADIKHGDVDTGHSAFKRIDRYRVFIKIGVFFEDFKIFWTLAFLCFPRCHFVYTHQAGRTPTLQR